MHAHAKTARLAAPASSVFDFLADIENLPRWAVTFCKKLARVEGGYRVTTPGGDIWFRIDGDAKTGVIDLRGGPDPDRMAHWPMRVIDDGLGGSVLTFTAIQAPAESDEVFARQCAALDHEFEVLRAAVERHPKADAITKAPLRNRMRALLKAPVAKVWPLIGDLARLADYSAGLERVDAKTDVKGRCTEYTCHFKPMAPGGERIVSREIMRWYEPNVGYASSSAGADAFGMENDLNLVVLEPLGGDTLLTWSEYFDAQDLAMMKAHFDDALADTGANLAQHFGGAIIERYVEGLQP